ncbi:MAG TPA: DUF1080 domain-containing protein [Opitutaceae bacterium]|nr:DUF1080 domain-containing protein [Opitutaceae bacterium]
MKLHLFAPISAMLALAAVAADSHDFVPARPDARIGDWEGKGSVVQVYADAGGKLQGAILPAFDQPNARPSAVRPIDDIDLAGFKQVARPSPTLGAKPPAGAIVLFDGTHLDAWATKSGKDWLKPAGPASWKIVDGAMEVVPAADSLITKRNFGDAHVHLEFRTLGAPTNSGIYLQTRYEVNINETYGHFEGTPSGGLDNCTDVKPRIRASRPPLAWQTLDIDFIAPRFDAAGRKTAAALATVRLNGVTLYERQELNLPKGAAGRLGEAAQGPFMLQEHGSPLQFRNIWVVEKK